MAFQWFREYTHRIVADQALTTVGVDFILEDSENRVLYVTQPAGHYAGLRCLPGTLTRRVKSKTSLSDEVLLNDILNRELGIGLGDLDAPLIFLPDFSPAWLDVRYTQEQLDRLDEELYKIETTDGTHPELGRVAVSICAVSKINQSIRLLKVNERYSKHEFLREVPSDLAGIYIKHLGIYTKAGSYDNLSRIISPLLS